MQSKDLIFIGIAEVTLLLLVICAVLILQNRSLRQTLHKLKERVAKVMSDLHKARASSAQAAGQGGTNYREFVDSQLKMAIQHHKSLGSNQDIALDLEPGTPLPQRAAALRYALLIAEKEAFNKRDGKQEPDWDLLRQRYSQIFDYHTDFAGVAGSGASAEELAMIKHELDNAKKRAKNLEKFKELYLTLEEKWEESSAEAKTHFDTLSMLAAQLDNPNEFEAVLDKYNTVYADISELIGRGADEAAERTGADGSSDEVKRLREVATEQHKIISTLQKQLTEATTEQEKNEVVIGLQGELHKQIRFVQESETCIQLLEDELHTANKEIEQLKTRALKVQNLKAEMLELRKSNDELDLKVQTLGVENRKLQKRLQEIGSSPKVDAGESLRLRKELAEMEARYNDLEEKFLDLKLQQ